MIFGFVGVFTFMYLLGMIDRGDGTDSLSDTANTLLYLLILSFIAYTFVAIDN